MPCSGPSQDHAYQAADEIIQTFLAELREKHHIAADEIGWKKVADEYAKAEAKFRESFREMIWLYEAGTW